MILTVILLKQTWLPGKKCLMSIMSICTILFITNITNKRKLNYTNNRGLAIYTPSKQKPIKKIAKKQIMESS